MKEFLETFRDRQYEALIESPVQLGFFEKY